MSSRPQEIDPHAALHQAHRLARASTPPWLHSELAGRMIERLPVIKLQPSRVLQWPGFLGASHELLKQTYPQAEQVCVEELPELAARSRQQHERGWLARMTRQAEVQVISPAEMAPASAQLLWSHLDLHTHADLPGLIAQWHRSIEVEGFVMFSCFGPDSFRELRALHVREGFGPAGPEWWDMHDIGDLMVQAGFADPVMDQERITLTWGEVEDLLRDLRAIGGNLAPARFAGLRSRAWRERYVQALESLRNAEGRLALTLELVQGHAFKPRPKLKVAAQTEVSLDHMREMLKKG